MAEKNRAAQALGALGGKARARALSRERQSEIGRKAGLASAAKRKLNKEQTTNEHDTENQTTKTD